MESSSSETEPDATVRAGRIESKHNRHLAEVVPHVYGAVFAYAMYVLARLVIALQAYYRTDVTPPADALSGGAFAILMVLFVAISFFMIQDVGEIMKFSVLFPMRRSSRYSHELIIASFYLASFALIEERNLLAWGAFGAAVFWGAIWCNQLKGEYLGDKSNVADLARTLRDLQYGGGGLFMVETGIFIGIQRSPAIDWKVAVAFGSSFAVWLIAYVAIPANKHRGTCNGLLVNTLVPDSLVLWLQSGKSVNLSETSNDANV